MKEVVVPGYQSRNAPPSHLAPIVTPLAAELETRDKAPPSASDISAAASRPPVLAELQTNNEQTQSTAPVTSTEASQRSLAAGTEGAVSDLPEPVHELQAPVQEPPIPAAPPYSLMPEVVEGPTTPPPAQDAEVTNIEAELDRLDREIAERERLQQLRDQRAQLAARLRDARG